MLSTSRRVFAAGPQPWKTSPGLARDATFTNRTEPTRTIPRVVRWFLFSTPAKTDGQSIFDGRDTTWLGRHQSEEPPLRCSTSITLDACSFAKPRRSSECFLPRMIPEVFLEDGGAGYPWPESWGRNWYRKFRETRSSSSQKRSERGQEVLATPRVEYPWSEQMDRKMLRNVEKRGVQAARDGPSLPPCASKNGDAARIKTSCGLDSSPSGPTERVSPTRWPIEVPATRGG